MEMVSDFPTRLNEALNGMSQAELADKIGISKQAISTYINGTRSPKQPTIEAICRALNVSPAWLLGYDVEKSLSATIKPKKSDDEILGTMPVGTMYRIPIIGSVRCGFGGQVIEELIGYDYADVKNHEEYMFFQSVGDSMEPYIEEGDLALVHQQPDVESGELAVVILNGDEGVLKKVIKKGKAITLVSFNNDYEPVTYLGEELNDIRIYGKVVETKKKW